MPGSLLLLLLLLVEPADHMPVRLGELCEATCLREKGLPVCQSLSVSLGLTHSLSLSHQAREKNQEAMGPGGGGTVSHGFTDSSAISYFRQLFEAAI